MIFSSALPTSVSAERDLNEEREREKREGSEGE